MTDYTELQEAAEYAAQDTIKFADEDEEVRALQQFHEEVNPETVLALIADLDEARNGMKHSCAIRLKKQIEQLETERDQLKAEVDSLTREADRQYTTIEAYRLNAERYQWLREADWWRSPICVIRNPKEQAKLGSDCPSGERLDEAVDAAMGKGEQS